MGRRLTMPVIAAMRAMQWREAHWIWRLSCVFWLFWQLTGLAAWTELGSLDGVPPDYAHNIPLQIGAALSVLLWFAMLRSRPARWLWLVASLPTWPSNVLAWPTHAISCSSSEIGHLLVAGTKATALIWIVYAPCTVKTRTEGRPSSHSALGLQFRMGPVWSVLCALGILPAVCWAVHVISVGTIMEWSPMVGATRAWSMAAALGDVLAIGLYVGVWLQELFQSTNAAFWVGCHALLCAYFLWQSALPNGTDAMCWGLLALLSLLQLGVSLKAWQSQSLATGRRTCR